VARHESLAEQLKALKAYRDRPDEGAPVEMLKTNWSTVAANDNNPEEVSGMHVERRLRMRPTDADMTDEALGGAVVRGPDVFSEHFGRMVPGPIIQIGDLRFSDGTNTEKAYTYGPDGKLTQYDARMPVGALLGATERQERMLGGDEDASDANATCTRIVTWLGAKRSRSKPRLDRDRSGDRNCTAAEARKMLDDALANTDPAKVMVTHAHKAMPWKPTNSAELFLGMKKTTKGESGSIAWQDIVGHVVEKEVWAKSIDDLKPETRDVLVAVGTAKNLASIGGHGHKRTAERRGKRLLEAANDDLAGALQKYSS